MLAIIVGVFGGFISGVALSSFIGIVGFMLLNEPIGIKYLPYFTAVLGAILVPLWSNKG